jgi:uncharacterized protein (DUF1499 family)
MIWWLLLLIPIGWALLAVPSWRRPALGLVDGHLRRCPDTPNCVCSEGETGEHAVASLTFEDAPAAAWERLVRLLQTTPRVQIITQEPTYLRAEFVTPLMRYVDDVEFRLDGQQIHVRSASRVGRSDLGANRARIEKLRAALTGKESAAR